MRHVVGLAEPGLFQLDSLRELVEQPTAPAEHDVDQVDPDLVHEPRSQELLVGVRAHQPDPLLRSDFLGLREGTLDPVGGEREYRLRARGWPVGDHEARPSPSGPLSPHASIELSYDRRPMITAPVSVSTDRGGVDGPLPRRYPDHYQNDTQPAFSTSYGLMTTFTFRSSPTTDWKALATRVARSCSASLVRVGSSQRSTLILATVARKPSGS